MQVSVEETSKIGRRLTVIVPANRLDDAYNARINKIAETAKIDGFRPGKVPLNYVKERFGVSAQTEALQDVIKSSLYSAIDQEKLRVAGVPRVEPKTALLGVPLEFIATFEVLPTIDTVHFDVKNIEKVVSVLTESDVDNVIDKIRAQQAKWIEVDRPAAEKDRVIIDFSGSIDGVPLEGGQAKNYPVMLGSKTMIPGFEEGLLQMKKGEERDITVTFPEDYFSKEAAGKKAVFKMKMHRVEAPELPKVDEAFIKSMGMKQATAESFRAEIRKNIERELQSRIQAQLQSRVFEKLLEQNAIDVPEALITQEAERIHQQMHPHHAGKENSHSEAEMSEFRTMAKRNVTLGLLVAELIKQFHLVVDKERLKSRIDAIATAYEKGKEVEDWYTNNPQARSEIEMLILEEQVVDKLLESVTITEKNISYDEFLTSTTKGK